MHYNFFTYILTNPTKTVLYTGVTNDLERRIEEHKIDALGKKKTFAGKYNCYNLIWFDRFQYIQHAIDREKEIKGWTRKKKEELIATINPTWVFWDIRE